MGEKQKFREEMATFNPSDPFTYNDLLGFLKEVARQGRCNHQSLQMSIKPAAWGVGPNKPFIQVWRERVETAEEQAERQRLAAEQDRSLRLAQVRQSAEILGFELTPLKVKLCQAGRDGDCFWECCPQERDGEPARTGRSCPYRKLEDDDEI